MDKYDLEDQLIEFSVLIIEIVNEMPNTKAGNHLSGQLVRSGTSFSLNYGKALRCAGTVCRIKKGFRSQNEINFEGITRDICLSENNSSK